MLVKNGIRQRQWTNPSVTSTSLTGNPVEDILKKVRAVVFSAMQKGWSGPPFDPFKLAGILKISVIPSEDILDARIIVTKRNKFTIEFNPNRPLARIRYSIAHELAHTLFPDCAQRVRERQIKEEMEPGDWELEMLCNIGAAEILMPIGSFPKLARESLDIDTLMSLRKQYKVSAEATLLRAVKLTDEQCAVFCSSRREAESRTACYQIDYMIPSRTNEKTLPVGHRLPRGSYVEECAAVGFTAKGDEAWPRSLGRVHVECVALPPYPGHRYPRVAGVVSRVNQVSASVNRIQYLKGDATEPRGEGNGIIAFIVNDKGRSWGAGFARAVQKKWPFVLEEFQHWIMHDRGEFSLGSIHKSEIEGDLSIVEMISQHGYGESATPRIRYGALEVCLQKLAGEALRKKASVHIPRIGCGQAGGSWWIVSELIEEFLLKAGIKVTVYDLPNASDRQPERQLSFMEG